MTPAPPDDADEVLAQWLEDVPALVAGLPLRLPAGLPVDLSRQSLAELNAFVLARFPDQRAVRADDELTRDLVVRLTAYLGEALLAVAGGSWRHDTDPDSVYAGQLVVQPADDTAFPVAPLYLITAACGRRRLGDLFVAEYDQLAERTRRRQAAEPGWEPRRAGSPAAATEPSPPDGDAWLADGDRALAAYVATLPPPGPWDLSPASLDALAAVLLDRHPDLAAWQAAPEAERDGAVRYVGEVVRRATGGYWESFPGEPDDDDMFSGRHVVQVGTPDDHWSFAPHLLLEDLLDLRDPAVLRRHPALGG